MHQINIHEAKTHLSRLIEEAIQGEPFIIAKAGKPLVKVVAVGDELKKTKSRIGFMSGAFVVPSDFDSMGQEEIHQLFGDTE